MTPAEWLVLVGVCALGAASPGPSLVVVAGHALAGSRTNALSCALAHAFGVGLYALATVGGLAAALVARPGLYRGIALAGAAYLAWLGLRQWRSAGPSGTPISPRAGGEWAAARDGFVMALLNPKIALFFLAVFSQFVIPARGWEQTLTLWVTATAVDGAWYAAVALLLTEGSWLARLRAHGVWLDRAMALVLLGLAASTAYRTLLDSA